MSNVPEAGGLRRTMDTPVKLNAGERNALSSLARGEVNCTSTRRNYQSIEDKKLSERYLDDSHGVRVWKWRLTAAGRSWLASWGKS